MDEERNRRRFVDTNIFLYVIQAHPKHGETSREILKRIDRGQPGVTSLINLGEICWWLEKHKKGDLIKEKVELINSILNLEIVPLTREDFIRAGEFIKKYRIDFNDCLCLSVMERLKINEIYSNDEDFDQVGWVKRIFSQSN